MEAIALPGVVKFLLGSGALGVLALIGWIVAYKKDKQCTALQQELKDNKDAHSSEIKRINEQSAADKAKLSEQHQQSMIVLYQRFVKKAETWIQKYYQYTRANHQLISAMEENIDEPEGDFDRAFRGIQRRGVTRRP